MDHTEFRALVAEAIDGLPGEFRERLANIDVVVEDWPDAAVLRKAGHQRPADLLGFYQGVPQTRRTRHYGLVLPDKISIFQRPIEMRCRTPEEVRDLIGHVVKHEVAHHFGIGDARLRELDAY